MQRTLQLIGSSTAPSVREEPMSSALSPLAIAGLTVSYGDRPVVVGVDFVVESGSMTAIVGPNGAGKSTLIKAALGIVPRVSGEISIFGRPLRGERHHIAYVPQRASV